MSVQIETPCGNDTVFSGQVCKFHSEREAETESGRVNSRLVVQMAPKTPLHSLRGKKKEAASREGQLSQIISTDYICIKNNTQIIVR